jgi:tRNA threonylcarbamoyladenosine biosynthesis protein TsaE
MKDLIGTGALFMEVGTVTILKGSKRSLFASAFFLLIISDTIKVMISKSLKETLIYAETVLKSLTPKKEATILALRGDLGSGKTAFTKAVAKILGVKEHITSPTFVIMKRYALRDLRYAFLIHIDAYRLETAEELLHLGWEEIVKDPKNLICIEWPERVRGVIPKDAVNIMFRFIDEDSREIIKSL